MKALFNDALVKEQLKRFLPISLISFLVYLAMLLPFWRDQMMAYNYPDVMQYGYRYGNYLSRLLSVNNFFMPVLMMIYAFIAVLVIFSYMFSSKSAGIMHTYPVTKNKLFVGNVLTGYLLVLMPFFVFCILLSFPASYILVGDGTLFHVNSISQIVSFFFRNLLVFSFYFSVFLLAASLSGNTIYYFIIAPLLVLLPAGVNVLFEMIKSLYFFGGGLVDISKKVLVSTNPIAISTALKYEDSLFIIIGYIVMAVALFAVAMYLYKIRKLERSGDTIVFMPMKRVFVFIISVIGMIFVGVFFVLIFGDNIAPLYIGFAVGFIISYFISQMIVEKNLNIFAKRRELKYYLLVVVSGFAFIFIVSATDITGYTRYQPKQEEIKGVFFDSYYTDEKEELLITDQEIISLALEAHKEIIDNRSKLFNVFVGNSYEAEGKFVYVLNNGKTVSRKFAIAESFCEGSKIKELWDREEVIFQQYPWIYNLEMVEDMDGRLYSSDTSVGFGFIEDKEEIESLLTIVKEEYLENERSKTHPGEYTDWENQINIYVSLEYDPDRRWRPWRTSLSYSSFEKTEQWIKEHGYYGEEEEW